MKLVGLQTRQGCYKRKGKKNEELILLTLAVPLAEGLEQRVQLLVQKRKQVDVSYRIKK